MSQWGRKIYQSWPSRHPVWTISAFFGAVAFFMLAVALQYARSWSFVERFYLPVYARTWMHGLFPKAQTRYSLIAGLTAKGQRRNALADEVEAATNAQGQTVYVLTEEGRRNCAPNVLLVPARLGHNHLDDANCPAPSASSWSRM